MGDIGLFSADIQDKTMQAWNTHDSANKQVHSWISKFKLLNFKLKVSFEDYKNIILQEKLRGNNVTINSSYGLWFNIGVPSAIEVRHTSWSKTLKQTLPQCPI